jgi:hypothetical protein
MAFPRVKILRIRSLHTQPRDPMDQCQINCYVVVEPQISTMVTRQQQLDTCIYLLVSSKVRNLHDVEQGGLREVMGPLLRDDLQILPFGSGEVLMQGEHVVGFAISKVEVSKLQRCNLILVCSHCVDPLREVRSDQGVVEVSGHTVSIYCTTQRGNICR